MCLAVYIASSKPLRLVEWVEDHRDFHVAELNKNERRVKKQFSLPQVYYAGSHIYCGCGFIKEGEEGEALLTINRMYSKLAAYIMAAQKRNAEIQIFCCWEGDQDSVPDYHLEIYAKDLEAPDFEFKEKAFYQIKQPDL